MISHNNSSPSRNDNTDAGAYIGSPGYSDTMLEPPVNQSQGNNKIKQGSFIVFMFRVPPFYLVIYINTYICIYVTVSMNFWLVCILASLYAYQPVSIGMQPNLMWYRL